MPVTLDPRAVRSLTNREISKMLCAMLNGIAVIEPATTVEFHEMLTLGRQLLDVESTSPDGAEILRQICKGEEVATWRVAIGATIGGLKHWCERIDIETAIMWVDENLPRMFKSQLN